MKKNQVIVRTLMAAVIMFGVETTASAQFGGLLKKAKSVVKEKVTGEEEKSNGSYQGSAVRNARGETKNANATSENPALKAMNERSEKAEKAAKASGGITIKHKERGIMMGTYYPDEHKWVRSDGSYIIIGSDGTAKWDDGTSAGKLTTKGFSTNGIKQMNYSAETDAFSLPDGTLISTMADQDDGTMITLLGKEWMQTSAPVDHKTLGFLTIGMGQSEEILRSQIKNNAAQAEAEAYYKRIMNPKRPTGRESYLQDKRWLDGSEKGKPEEDDEWLFANGSLRFNSVYVATYEDNILDNFYNHSGNSSQDNVLGKYVNGGLKDRHGKYLGKVDSNWNIINAAGKKVGYVENGRMYTADGKSVGYCMGSYTKFTACFVFFMYLKL